jgi:hypothetical protein
MNLTAFSLLANSNQEVDERQEMELTIGSLSFYVGPSGSTRLSDLAKLGPSASKTERITTSGSSVGKQKEKIHVSTREWRIIMSAINHGTEVPKGENSRFNRRVENHHVSHQSWHGSIRRFKERSSDGISIRIALAQKEVEGGKRHVYEKPR